MIWSMYEYGICLKMCRFYKKLEPRKTVASEDLDPQKPWDSTIQEIEVVWFPWKKQYVGDMMWHIWLVVWRPPLWKKYERQLGWLDPQYMGK